VESAESWKSPKGFEDAVADMAYIPHLHEEAIRQSETAKQYDKKS
jgi:hypothetical protein